MTESDKQLLKNNNWFIECEMPLEIRHEDGSFATQNAAQNIILLLKIEDILADSVEFQVWDDVLVMSKQEIKENFGVDVPDFWDKFMRAREYRFYIGEKVELEGRAGFYTMLFTKENPKGFFIEFRFVKRLMNRSKRNYGREILRVETEF